MATARRAMAAPLPARRSSPPRPCAPPVRPPKRNHRKTIGKNGEFDGIDLADFADLAFSWGSHTSNFTKNGFWYANNFSFDGVHKPTNITGGAQKL